MFQSKSHSKALTLSSQGSLAFESIDTRLVSLMRLILAISALLIIYIDPSEPDRFVNLTYGLLGLYSFYSLVLYILSARHSSFLQRTFMHWLDVSWYIILISLSHGTNSLFFFYFFFIILVASFRSGYLTGLRITVVSAILFTIVGFLTAPAGSGIELNRFLLRPTYLIVIGYLMAYWGGAEIVLKRRLALLNEVSKLSNPRFGVDQTISSFMERLRSFYDAEACILIMSAMGSDDYLIRHSYRDKQEHAINAEIAGAETRSLLLDWPSDSAVTYKAKRGDWWPTGSPCKAYNLSTGEQIEIDQERCEAIADLLDAGSLVSVPLQRRDTIIGRLFLTSRERRFNHHDIDFLRQLVEHVVPIIDSIQLVDRLASEASEQERQKISRDIHDSAIQPYIGLKFGLDALSRKVAPDDLLKGEINELLGVTNEAIKDLRH
jgi:signal transduction histidine kinase